MKKYQFELFCKKVGKKLLLLVAICAGLFVLTQLIAMVSTFNYTGNKTISKNDQLKEIYNTNVFGDEGVSKKDIDKYINIIDSFVMYCNKKEYQKAYDLLNPEYKEILMPNIDEFIKYVDLQFDKQKAYSYQNITNKDNYYVYDISLYDDVMMYGTTSYDLKTEKSYMTVKEVNDKLYLALDGFIERVNINREVKGEFLDLMVIYKDVYYSKVDVKVKYKNNLSDIVVIASNDINYTFLNGNKVHNYSTYNYMLIPENTILMANAERESTYRFQIYYNIPEYKEYSFSLKKIKIYDAKDVFTIINDLRDISATPKAEYDNFVVEL